MWHTKRRDAIPKHAQGQAEPNTTDEAHSTKHTTTIQNPPWNPFSQQIQTKWHTLHDGGRDLGRRILIEN
jgi:hypothetical protein